MMGPAQWREADGLLLTAIRCWAWAGPRWGYVLVAGRLQEEDWAVRLKRVHRLLKQPGSRLSTKVRKPRSLGDRLKPTHRSHAPGCGCISTGPATVVA